MTIYIGNLSFQAEQEHLSDLFAEYGEVKNCSLPLDRETGRKRGFAFVEMVNDADEQKAIEEEIQKFEVRFGGAAEASTTYRVS